MTKSKFMALTAVLGLAVTVGAGAIQWKTPYDPMMKGKAGWQVEAVWTVSEVFNGYQPVGIPDGIGAYRKDKDTVCVLVSHELGSSVGAPYELANGVELKGARVSTFLFDRDTRRICGAHLSYDTVYDRAGNLVTQASQLGGGFDRFCSGQLVEEGSYGFRDTIYFTGEETGNGTEWALDVENSTLWAAPDLGRGAWENVTALNAPGNKVALLLGDDTAGAPLYLYVGERGNPNSDFLARNGLEGGQLHVWVADNGDTSPQAFNGPGGYRKGSFVALDARDASKAGQAGYDALGYKNDTTLRAEAVALGAFRFSRPEDLATNPRNGRQAAFCSTGRGQLFSADNWGTIYEVTVKFGNTIRADLHILHDADALPTPDGGIRNPDNCDWAGDGMIYVNEDRSTFPDSLFGGTTGKEASIWQLNPDNYVYTRIAEMDRNAVAPSGASDPVPDDVGNWESSGVLDVTRLFSTRKGERLLIADVEAHSVTNGTIASDSLVQGGQIIFLSKIEKKRSGRRK